MSASDDERWASILIVDFIELGDKAILLCFFQNPWHAREIAGRGKNDLWLHDNLGDVITAPWQLL